MSIFFSYTYGPQSGDHQFLMLKLMLVHSLRDGPLYDQERQIIILVVFINRIV